MGLVLTMHLFWGVVGSYCKSTCFDTSLAASYSTRGKVSKFLVDIEWLVAGTVQTRQALRGDCLSILWISGGSVLSRRDDPDLRLVKIESEFFVSL